MPESCNSYFPMITKSRQQLAGNIAETKIKWDPKVDSKLAMEVDQKLTKVGWQSWPAVDQS